MRNRCRGQILDSRRKRGSQSIWIAAFCIFILSLPLEILTYRGVFFLLLSNAVFIAISALLLLLTLIHKHVNFGRSSKLILSNVLNLLILIHFLGVTRRLNLLLFNIDWASRCWSFQIFRPERKVERILSDCKASCLLISRDRVCRCCKRASLHS